MSIIKKLFSRKEDSDKVETHNDGNEVSGIDMIVNKACGIFEENFSSVLEAVGPVIMPISFAGIPGIQLTGIFLVSVVTF